MNVFTCTLYEFYESLKLWLFVEVGFVEVGFVEVGFVEVGFVEVVLCLKSFVELQEDYYTPMYFAFQLQQHLNNNLKNNITTLSCQLLLHLHNSTTPHNLP